MALQHWRQVPPELRDALQTNCDVQIAFKAGRADAELLARALGRVNPYLVKDEAKSDYQRDSYMSISEQFELWTEAVQNLVPREAFVRTSGRPATKIRTLNVPDPKCDPALLRQVLDRYAQMYLRAASEIEAEARRADSDNSDAQEPHFKRMWQQRFDAKN